MSVRDLRTFALVIIACVANACYQSPSLRSCKYQCGGANNDSCPSGYSCADGMCVVPGEGCDGDGGVIDAPPDAPDDAVVIDGPVCANPMAVMWVAKPALTTEALLKQVVVFDTNNDTTPDLAVLDNTNAIGVFLGNGDGTFGPRRETGVNNNAIRMIVGDFDHDMQRDDLMVLSSDNNVSRLLGQNNGLFTKMSMSLTSGTPIDIANAGDLDGDMDEDIVVLYGGGSPKLQIFLQQSGNSLMQGQSVATSASPTSLFIGNVDSGTVRDAVVTYSGANQIGLQIGVAGPTFETPPVLVNTMLGPAMAVAGQLKTVGGRSVVTANNTAGANNVSVRYLVTGTSFMDGGNPGVGMRPISLVLADVAGSPLPDIITANNADDTFSVLVNTDDNTWAAAVPTATVAGPIDIVSADFDKDGRQDIAVAHVSATAVIVYLNKCP